MAPEIPRDWELGLKSTWLDHRLRVNATLFHTVFDGFQTEADTFAGNQIVVLTVNAGQLLTEGAELEFSAVPVTGLTLSGGVTYDYTKYEGLPDLPCYPGQAPGSGVNECNAALSGQDVNGDALEEAPRWTETFTARYQHLAWTGWDGFVQGNAHIQSPMNFQVGENPSARLGSQTLVGLSLGAQTNDGNLILTLFVRNLFDRRVPTFIGEENDSEIGDSLGLGATGDYQQQFGESSFRTIGISFDYRR